jgi:hypothetical protein
MTYLYDQNKTKIEWLNEFNNIQPSIKFTIKKEQHEKINYSDNTIHCKDKRLEFSIYRKPTQTDIIIPDSSCHPYKHKVSDIKYLLYQLYTYPITKKSKQTEKTLQKHTREKRIQQKFTWETVTTIATTKHIRRSKTLLNKMGRIYILQKRSKTNNLAF